MTDLAPTMASDFATYYEFVGEQVHKWVDPLTDEQFWRLSLIHI